MPLTVLTDEEIRFLLENLTKEELLSFRNELRGALHQYSTGTQKDSGWKSIHQPERTSIHNDVNGTNTLFMPSSGPGGIGIKVVTLSSANHQTDPSKQDNNTPPVIKPTGAITLLSPLGAPIGFLHASTLTAFRTALASLCLVSKRDTVRTLTVFGSGEQAYWHVRLALLLRGDTIRHVNIITRRFSPGIKTLLGRFYGVPAATKSREGWTDCVFGVLTQGYGEYARLLTEQVRSADVIFCCTPSTEPLFEAGVLTEHEGRRKGRLIVAIGSYTPEMREVPVEVIQQAVRPHGGEKGGLFHFRHAVEGGVVIVDTLDGLKEAGELIDAGLEPKQVVELGELVMLREIALASEDDGVQVTDSSLNVTSEMLEKLDIDSASSLSNTTEGSSLSSGQSAMSSVFGSSSSKSERKKSFSRPSSPSRKSLTASFFHRRSHSHSSQHHDDGLTPGGSDGTVESKHSSKQDKHSDTYRLARWLQKGNVIYKSVGLALMDLTVGMAVIRFAEEKGVGSRIEGF